MCESAAFDACNDFEKISFTVKFLVKHHERSDPAEETLSEQSGG